MERRNVTLIVEKPQEVGMSENIITEGINGLYVPFSNEPYQRRIKINPEPHLNAMYTGSEVLVLLKEYEEYVISSIGSFDIDRNKWFEEFTRK